MDTTILRKAGLTDSQAKGYLALIEHGALTPTQLANHTGESRTNGYAITDKLTSLGLAVKDESNKPAVFVATHPSALEALAERRRKIVVRDEHQVKQGLGDLINFFYEHSDKPGVRYLEGVDGQLKVYEDILATNETMYLVRTPNERKFLGKQVLKDFIAQRVRQNIQTIALTPFLDDSNMDPRIDDAQKMTRQFMPAELYTAPVEIDIYGSRVSFISFGDELSGLIIENKHIADAMRQLFKLAEIGAKISFNERADLVESLASVRKGYEEALHSAE